MTLIACVAHHTRLDTLPEADVVFVDHGDHGALWNHARALVWAATQDERVWIVEDDAVLCDGFRERAAEWGARFPDALISGYLGTGRPQHWQRTIRRSLTAADTHGRDHVTLPTLLHGVCYSLPAGARLTPSGSLAADEAVGKAWGRPVIYTVPSLADHADRPSVEKHPDGQTRTEPRKAWRIA